MTDDEDDEGTMALPTSSDLEDHRSMEANLLAIESRKNERYQEIQKYQKLISTKTPIADAVVIEIVQALAASGDVGDERILLGGIALVNVLFTNYHHDKCINTLTALFSLEDGSLWMWAKQFYICDLEWFKVAIAHGYFKANVDELLYTPENMLLTFAILEKHCLRYTKYSYITYKVLQAWLNKWHKRFMFTESFTPGIESRLEAIIFSNWDNCISDIARRNATKIFPTYLRAMSDKYEGFLKYILYNCIERLSWKNPTKYTILVEVCTIFNDLDSIAYSSLPRRIFTSLTKSHLKSSGTLLYKTILNKLTTKKQWEEIFGTQILRESFAWENEGNVSAVEILWEQWMKPTIAKFPDIFDDQWNNYTTFQLTISYFLKIKERLGLKFLIDHEQFEKFLKSSIGHISEAVRLNAFAIICQLNNWKIVTNSSDPFAVTKRFLYLNADASTVTLRKGVLENFKIFFSNVVKLAETDVSVKVHVSDYLVWMQEFLNDCFEIGSSYQRKIFGLNLYSVILNFTNDDTVDGLSRNSTKCQATLKCARNLRLKMIEENQWNFVDATTAILLVKLVVDQTSDVREKSTSILIRYFTGEVFTNAEKNVIFVKAKELCNSSMFYEIAGGSALMKVLSAWRYTEVDYVDFFLARAIGQLEEMRKDILMSTVQGSPFYGALTVILELGVADPSISNDTTRRILDVTEEGVIFFLSAFSTRDEASSSSGYSSSFEDMSLAIEESIRTSELNEDNEEGVVSPAHQLVVSCIWMSLKVCCELAAEIGSRAAIPQKEAIRAVNIIVSVLLKCRHKGAISVAGVAIAKLTKALLCKDEYVPVMKEHLIKLLRIGNDSKINLTRRGAGLTIMFHRIVSSDVRINRPFLHYAVVELLNSLKQSPDLHSRTRNEEYLRDSTRVRHLQFLQSLLADKSLQAQLVPYMEDICLMCFSHLQFPDWSVRNASLQLFGVIVPRLVGQSKETQLDYGIGSSVDHFVTHYPKLATKVLKELETFVGLYNWTKIIRFDNLPLKSNVLPILVLLSKMSTSGCNFIDYSSMEYIRRARETFKILLGHPVFHIRNVAAKAYAAFEPPSDILSELTNMMCDKIDPRYRNYNHGTLIAQSYLWKKLHYETIYRPYFVYKSDNYRSHLIMSMLCQIEKVTNTWQGACTMDDEKRPTSYTIHNIGAHVTGVALLHCLVNSKLDVMHMKFLHEDDHFGYLDLSLIENLETRGLWKPDWLIFIEREFFSGSSFTCLAHPSRISSHDLTEFYNWWLKFLVDNALKLFDDPSNFHTLYCLIRVIGHYVFDDDNEETQTILCGMSSFTKLTTKLMEIDEKSSRPRAISLKCWGLRIAIETKAMDEALFKKVTSFVHGMSQIDDFAINKMVIDDVISPLVQKSLCTRWLFFLHPRLKSTELFLTAIASLLMDENLDIRELVARRLAPLIQAMTNSRFRLCPKATLHKIFIKLTSSWLNDSNMNHHVLMIFKALSQSINVKSSSDGIKSPYDHDDDLQHDHTQFMDMLLLCVEIMTLRLSIVDSGDSRDLSLVEEMIRMKCKLQREAGIDVSNVETILKLSTSEYLSLKKEAFIQIINRDCV